MKTAIVTCDVFLDDVKDIVEEYGLDYPISSFEMAMHDHPEMMRERLQKHLESLESEGFEKTLLVYGSCGGGLQGLCFESLTTVLPHAHDCISIALGNRERHETLQKNEPQSYFLTHGWLDSTRIPGPTRDQWLREHYGSTMDDEDLEELMDADREAFDHYEQLVWVKHREGPEHRARAKATCEAMNWKLVEKEGTVDWVKDLLLGNHDSSRFIITPPGRPLEIRF